MISDLHFQKIALAAVLWGKCIGPTAEAVKPLGCCDNNLGETECWLGPGEGSKGREKDLGNASA